MATPTDIDPAPSAPPPPVGRVVLQPGQLSKPEKVWASSSALIIGFYQAAPYSEAFKIFYKKSGAVFGTQVMLTPASILGPELAVRQPMQGEAQYFEYEIKKLKPSTQYVVKIKTSDDSSEVRSDRLVTVSTEEERNRDSDMRNFVGALVKLGDFDGLVVSFSSGTGIFAIRILQIDDVSSSLQLARLTSDYTDSGVPVQAYTLSQVRFGRWGGAITGSKVVNEGELKWLVARAVQMGDKSDAAAAFEARQRMLQAQVERVTLSLEVEWSNRFRNLRVRSLTSLALLALVAVAAVAGMWGMLGAAGRRQRDLEARLAASNVRQSELEAELHILHLYRVSLELDVERRMALTATGGAGLGNGSSNSSRGGGRRAGGSSNVFLDVYRAAVQGSVTAEVGGSSSGGSGGTEEGRLGAGGAGGATASNKRKRGGSSSKPSGRGSHGSSSEGGGSSKAGRFEDNRDNRRSGAARGSSGGGGSSRRTGASSDDRSRSAGTAGGGGGGGGSSRKASRGGGSGRGRDAGVDAEEYGGGGAAASDLWGLPHQALRAALERSRSRRHHAGGRQGRAERHPAEWLVAAAGRRGAAGRMDRTLVDVEDEEEDDEVSEEEEEEEDQPDAWTYIHYVSNVYALHLQEWMKVQLQKSVRRKVNQMLLPDRGSDDSGGGGVLGGGGVGEADADEADRVDGRAAGHVADKRSDLDNSREGRVTAGGEGGSGRGRDSGGGAGGGGGGGGGEDAGGLQGGGRCSGYGPDNLCDLYNSGYQEFYLPYDDD